MPAVCDKLVACASGPCNRTSQIYNRNQPARVAESADAPELGKRNQRFQSITFRFRRDRFRETKMRFFTK